MSKLLAALVYQCWVRVASSTWKFFWLRNAINSDTPESNISRKRPRSLSLVSLNSYDGEEYWETTVIPRNGFSTKRMKLEQCKIFRLKGYCETDLLYYCVFVFCILVVTHTKDESDLQYHKNNLH